MRGWLSFLGRLSTPVCSGLLFESGFPDGEQSSEKQYYPNIKRMEMIVRESVTLQSSHSRGGAVDLTIFCLDTGMLVSMGSDFDFMDERSYHTTNGLTEAESRAWECPHHIMENSGFEAYCNEWWHYVLADEPYPNTYFNFYIA